MRLTTARIGVAQRYDWGWERRVDFIDAVGATHQEIIVTKTAPNEKGASVSAELLRVATQARLSAIVAEPAPETAETVRAELNAEREKAAVLTRRVAALEDEARRRVATERNL